MRSFNFIDVREKQKAKEKIAMLSKHKTNPYYSVFFFTFFSLIVRSCIIMRTHEKYLKEKTFDIYTNIQI